MRRLLTLILAAACISILPSIALADTVYLKNGNVLEGVIDQESPDTIEFNLGFGSVTLLKKEIIRIVKSDEKESQKLWQEWDTRKKEETARKPEIEKQLKEREAEADRFEKERQEKKIQADEYSPKEVKVLTDNGHFFVHVLLNGKVRAKLLLDSGATSVALPRRVADKLNIDFSQLKKDAVTVADGRIVEVAISKLDSIEVLSYETDKPEDLKPTGIKINSVDASFLTRENDVIIEYRDKIYVPDDGLLGMSFLKYFQLRLDYKAKKIVFQKNR